VTIWLVRLATRGDGPRLAVKDAIDVAGVPTTAACPVIADRAAPAERDAPVVAAARAQGVRVAGKTNLTELCRAADGVNPWTGTPENPLDPRLVPGGSSSGSAVAVAVGEADVALGTDTGGSVRIPAACCGVTGLKTTHGRVSLEGVFALAPSLDTVGPIGTDVASVALGMRLIEPGFAPGRSEKHEDGPDPAAAVSDWAGGREHEGRVVGRLRPVGPAIDPAVDAAVDAALRTAGLVLADERVEPWPRALAAGNTLLLAEGYRGHRGLLAYPERMSARIRRRIERGGRITDGMLDEAYATRTALRTLLDGLFERYPVLALPTLTKPPPRIGAERDVDLTELTLPFNLSGHPVLALPIPGPAAMPGSVQLVGPPGGEERLLAIGSLVEAALR
jgi:amidase